MIEPPTAICSLELFFDVGGGGGGLEMLSGVMWTGARMHHVLFHQENLDVQDMACWTKSALESSGGAVGPQR